MRKQGNNTNRPQVEEKKGKRRTLTVLGYALMIVFLLIVLPVVLPAIFGYHTYTVGSDATGNISKYGNVVYLKAVSNDSYDEGNIVAVQESDSSRKVDVYYVDANDTAAQTLAIREGETVSYEQIAGKVVAKTPFIGYLSQLCFSAAGIIVTILIFAAGLGLMMYVTRSAKRSIRRWRIRKPILKIEKNTKKLLHIPKVHSFFICHPFKKSAPF